MKTRLRAQGKSEKRKVLRGAEWHKLWGLREYIFKGVSDAWKLEGREASEYYIILVWG